MDELKGKKVIDWDYDLTDEINIIFEDKTLTIFINKFSGTFLDYKIKNN